MHRGGQWSQWRLVGALDETVHHPLASRLFKVDRELVAVDVGDAPVAELLMENTLPRRVTRGRRRRCSDEFPVQRERRALLAAVLAVPLLLGALPPRRRIAALKPGRGLIEAAAPIGVEAVAGAAAVGALGFAHLEMGLGELVDKARRRCRLPKATIAPVLREADLGQLLGPRHADVGQPPFLFEAGVAVLIEAALMRE